jgi:Lrp/AsnC family leucine-responsive transcriptional regulator
VFEPKVCQSAEGLLQRKKQAKLEICLFYQGGLNLLPNRGFAMTDDIDQVLITALMEDSRRSLKALAQISGLSSPSVAERLRRLEERGVLKGYTVEIDPKCFGYQLQAIVRIRPLPGQLQEVERQIQAIPEFTECDKVTGDDCFIARLHVRSMEQLDTLLDRLNTHAETNTAIVKKTPVKRRLPPMA